MLGATSNIVLLQYQEQQHVEKPLVSYKLSNSNVFRNIVEFIQQVANTKFKIMILFGLG